MILVVLTSPLTRRPHPSYGGQSIPAFEVVKDSVQIVRGRFGGLAFCSIVAHEGRIIQSRSPRFLFGPDPPPGRGAGLLGRGQRSWRPDGQHVPDQLHRARHPPKVPPPGLPAPGRLRTAGSRSWAAREPMCAARGTPGVDGSSWPLACGWTWPSGARPTWRNWCGTTSADT